MIELTGSLKMPGTQPIMAAFDDAAFQNNAFQLGEGLLDRGVLLVFADMSPALRVPGSVSLALVGGFQVPQFQGGAFQGGTSVGSASIELELGMR